MKRANINGLNNDDETALHVASRNGKANVVQLLLDYGADVEAWNIRKTAALQEASFHGHDNVARLLLEKANFVQLLLENDITVNAVNARDGYNDTALHGASLNGPEDVARLLLQEDADITAMNTDHPCH
ncbi:ankyrin repeat-containing domain protein [Mycena leptocephala]|nr:ankyrin repeat-containing domain protein [Mycena leptocephala]